MATESERVVLLKQHFLELHMQGYTIPEIASKFNLSRSTVYRHLDAIAAQHQVSRDSLLQEVHETPASWVRKSNLLKVNGDELLAKFNTAHDLLSEILENIGTLMQLVEEDLNEKNYS